MYSMILKANGPLKINIGALKTDSHDVNLRFVGLESLLYEDLCKEPTQQGAGKDIALPAVAILCAGSTPSVFHASKTPLVEKPIVPSEDVVENTNMSGDFSQMQLNQDAPRRLKLMKRNGSNLPVNNSVIEPDDPKMSIRERIKNYLFVRNS
jgi:hypothetical protein